MSGCFSPLPLTTNPTHLDDLNDSHIEESEVVSATQYQDDFPLAVFSLNHISLAMIQPKSFSWPFDGNGLTNFPESHTKDTAILWYRHYLSSSQCCHAIISLVLFHLREHGLVVRRLARDFLFVSLSPWPMYYQCKWSVQLALIVIFTSKCLRNEVTGSLTLSAEVISRSKTISGTLKRTITFFPRDFCLRYYLDLSRGFFLYKVRHLWIVLWNVLWLKLVDVSIRHSLIKLMSRSIPLDDFYPWLLFHKDQDVWDTISMVHELSMM